VVKGIDHSSQRAQATWRKAQRYRDRQSSTRQRRFGVAVSYQLMVAVGHFDDEVKFAIAESRLDDLENMAYKRVVRRRDTNPLDVTVMPLLSMLAGV
jgi:hypothetical protein